MTPRPGVRLLRPPGKVKRFICSSETDPKSQSHLVKSFLTHFLSFLVTAGRVRGPWGSSEDGFARGKTLGNSQRQRTVLLCFWLPKSSPPFLFSFSSLPPLLFLLLLLFSFSSLPPLLFLLLLLILVLLHVLILLLLSSSFFPSHPSPFLLLLLPSPSLCCPPFLLLPSSLTFSFSPSPLLLLFSFSPPPTPILLPFSSLSFSSLSFSFSLCRSPSLLLLLLFFFSPPPTPILLPFSSLSFSLFFPSSPPPFLLLPFSFSPPFLLLPFSFSPPFLLFSPPFFPLSPSLIPPNLSPPIFPPFPSPRHPLDGQGSRAGAGLRHHVSVHRPDGRWEIALVISLRQRCSHFSRQPVLSGCG
ncbi:uncharacterized protein [Patagioenas fasciata]|uniref:uncharacterized protein isoform X1 n=1 Tax=Patagioenas fasciata TaxID=372321 RepID=UPI003A99B00C